MSLTPGRNADGTPYVEISYFVSLGSSSAQGGYGLQQTSGPLGSPVMGLCTPGGSFIGSTSGTCRWGNFAAPASGAVQFQLSSHGGIPTTSCTRTASTFIGDPPPTPTPTAPPLTPTPTPPPTHECSIALTPGTDATGRPYVAISYSVSLGSSGAQGGYGLHQAEGPLGGPVPGACTPGGQIFGGSTSGTCVWGNFAEPASGWVRFGLTSSGSAPNGAPTVCNKSAGTFIGGAGCSSACSRPDATCGTSCQYAPPGAQAPVTVTCEAYGRLFPDTPNNCAICLPRSACDLAPQTGDIFCAQAGGLENVTCHPLGTEAGITCGNGAGCSILCNPQTHQVQSQCSFTCGDDICTEGFENHDNCPEDCEDQSAFARANVLTYNLNFLNGLAECECDAVACLPWEKRVCSLARVPLIARHPLLADRDIVAFQEVFDDLPRARLRQALRGEYPYQTTVITGSSPGPITHSNGGVAVFSKWPILREDQHVYTVCNDFVDCASAKGVKYARIARPDGKVFHVYATHTDANLHGNHADDAEARRRQLLQMDQFVSSTLGTTNASSHVLLLAGDFNIDKNEPNSAEYPQMLSILHATPPTTVGGWTNLNRNWLDYVLNARAFMPTLLKPTHSVNESFAYAWDTEVPTQYHAYPQLSDHFPVLGSFLFELPGSGTAAPIAPPPLIPPLVAPVPLGPSGNVSSDLQRFRWGAVPGASSYELRVFDGEETDTAVLSVTIPETSFLSSEPLAAGRAYRWNVFAQNAVEKGPACVDQAFFYDDRPLGTPQPLSPAGIGPERYATFAWTPVDGAEAYRVEVRQAGKPVFDRLIPARNELVLPEPLEPGDYKWRVSARRGSKWSAASGESAFQVSHEGIDLPAPRPLSPEGVGPNGCTPGFSWDPIKFANSYEVTVVDVATEAVAMRLAGASTPLAPPTSFEPQRRYRWSVRAEKDGVRGAPSLSVFFECDPGGQGQ